MDPEVEMLLSLVESELKALLPGGETAHAATRIIFVGNVVGFILHRAFNVNREQGARQFLGMLGVGVNLGTLFLAAGIALLLCFRLVLIYLTHDILGYDFQ